MSYMPPEITVVGDGKLRHLPPVEKGSTHTKHNQRGDQVGKPPLNDRCTEYSDNSAHGPKILFIVEEDRNRYLFGNNISHSRSFRCSCRIYPAPPAWLSHMR